MKKKKLIDSIENRSKTIDMIFKLSSYKVPTKLRPFIITRFVFNKDGTKIKRIKYSNLSYSLLLILAFLTMSALIYYTLNAYLTFDNSLIASLNALLIINLIRALNFFYTEMSVEQYSKGLSKRIVG